MPQQYPEWPEKDVEQLKILASMGWTARKIGERLGYSKNAVLGKMRRIKISNVVIEKRSYVICDAEIKQPMDNNCLWPLGDKWCGEKRTENSPYCAYHHKIAYIDVKYDIEKDLKFIAHTEKIHRRFSV